MSPDDLEQIRRVVREEIEASKPKMHLNPSLQPGSEDWFKDWEWRERFVNAQRRRWWRR